MALIAVTDHAAERYRQRVRGTLDAQGEIVERVGRAWQAGRVSDEPPLSRDCLAGGSSPASPRRSPPPRSAAGRRGSVYVRDGSLVFVCREDRPRGEVVVVTLWQEGEAPAVPRRPSEAVVSAQRETDEALEAGERRRRPGG